MLLLSFLFYTGNGISLPDWDVKDVSTTFKATAKY